MEIQKKPFISGMNLCTNLLYFVSFNFKLFHPKETCELLTDPVLDLLKVKLKEFIKKYRKDDQPEFDYVLYEETIKELKKEFNKDSVKRALKGVLQNDILDNIEMKISAL